MERADLYRLAEDMDAWIPNSSEKIYEVKKCIDEMTDIVESITNFETRVIVQMKQATKKVGGLNGPKSTHTTALRKIYRSLSSTESKAQLCTKRVEDVCWHSTRPERIKQITKGMASCPPNFDALHDYVDQILRCLDQAIQFYKQFQTSCQNLANAASSEASMCTNSATEAKTRKYATRVVGGTLLTVGVIGSILAGAFTFGLDTVIGVVITTVGAATIGVGGAVATNYVAKDFKQLEEQLLELERNFFEIEQSASQMTGRLGNIHMNLPHIKGLDVQHGRDSETAVESLAFALKRLHEKLVELHKKQTETSTCLDDLISRWNFEKAC